MTKKKPSEKLIKYAKGVLAGKTKKQSAIDAGYDPTNISRIEKTDNYKRLSVRDEILKHKSLVELTGKLVSNAMQDDDLAASNAALKIALDRVEPQNNVMQDDEKVVVVLEQRTASIVLPAP